ncbi:MAG: ABC transporter [Alteromonadaceae bacterium]|nr:MAG: ABC transporter [Alteromonadaceae bacterium]
MHRSISHLVLLPFLVLCLFLSGCASNANRAPMDTEAIDRMQGFNRAMSSVNHRLDKWFLKPVAQGYDKAPKPVKNGVGNFFGNLSEVSNVLNDVLQWKWKQAGNDGSRFLINSTLGLLGLFDIASASGIEKSDGEDFAQTLAVWGVPAGSYIELPILGPRTLRGLAAWPVSWASDPLTYIEDDGARIGLNFLELVDTRAGFLELEKLATGKDRYLFIRDAYLQRRDYLIRDGVVDDDFGDEFDDEDFGDDDLDDLD